MVVVDVVTFAIFRALIERVAKVLDALFAPGSGGGDVDADDGIRLEEVGVDDEVVVLLDRRIQLEVLLEEAKQLRGGTIVGEV